MCLIQSSSQEGEKDDSKAVEKKAQQRTAVESEDFMPVEAVRAASIAHIEIVNLLNNTKRRERKRKFKCVSAKNRGRVGQVEGAIIS